MKTLRFAVIVALIVVLAFGVAASAQTAPEGQPKPAPNAWMLTPTPYLDWNKDIPSPVRAARDRHSDQGAGGHKYPADLASLGRPRPRDRRRHSQIRYPARSQQGCPGGNIHEPS